MATFSIALSGLTRRQFGSRHHLEQHRQCRHDRLQEFPGGVRRRVRLGAVNLNTSTAGEGVRLVASAQQFTQGNITTTSSPLDLAISGNGFFTLNSPSGNVYTRNGEFSEDAERQRGERDRGSSCRSIRRSRTAASIPARCRTSISTPRRALRMATSTGAVTLNLPSNATVPTRGAVRSDQSRTPTLSRPRPPCTTRSATPIPATFYFYADRDARTVDGQHDRQRYRGGRARRTLTFSNTGMLTTPAGGNARRSRGFNPPDGAQRR